jgi:hypothetical protein
MGMTAPTTIEQLLAALRDLPPWRNTDFKRDEWRRYLQAALLLQNTKPADAERAFLRFLDAGEGFTSAENETRIFLLMRVAFDLPESAAADQRRIFKGWTNWPAPDADGVVNLSWPVNWQRDQPELIAPFEGAEGPRYGAIEEYRYLLERFSFRRIEIPKKDVE